MPRVPGNSGRYLPSGLQIPPALASGSALTRKRLGYLLGFLAGHRTSIALVLALTVSAGGLGAVEPLLLKRVLDAAVARTGVRAIAVVLAALVALHLVREAMS